jgi:alpha-tubulin suppressor-like RCC1 family protein/uncharacterized protein YjdB
MRLSVVVAIFTALVLSSFQYNIVSASDSATITPSAISSGYDHSFMIDANQNLYAWGENSAGQVGDKSRVVRTAPVYVMNNVVKAVGGQYHSLSLSSQGTVWAWGNSGYGEFGNGSTSSSAEPVQSITNVKDIASGTNHALAIKSDDTLWSWGNNLFGQLGDGTTEQRTTPVQIMSGVKEIAAGEGHSLALKEDDTVWAWGSLDIVYSPIPRGLDRKSSPVQILDDVKHIYANGNQAFAITNDGALWSWGKNTYGQLGNGNQNFQSLPQKIAEHVLAVAPGVNHTAIIKEDGTLWSFGQNDNGQLGINSTVNMTAPVQVMEDVRAVAAGESYTLAIKEDGSIWSWGINNNGQLGNGSMTGSFVPAPVDLDSVVPPDPNDVPVTHLTLDLATVSLSAGQTKQLSVGLRPGNATDTTVHWSVESQSPANVVSVSSSGLVTALNPGTAVVRATSGDNADLYKECAISVVAAGIGPGAFIQFGQYYGQPILWKVIHQNGDGSYMLWSDKIVTLKAFDANGDDLDYDGDSNPDIDDSLVREFGSNYWIKSNLREWLNSSGTVAYSHQKPDQAHVSTNAYDQEPGFLTGFTEEERSLIKPYTHKVILSYAHRNLSDGGSTALAGNSSFWPDMVEHYDTAYYKNATDDVFLLGIKELHDYVYSRNDSLRKNVTPQASAHSSIPVSVDESWDYYTDTPDSHNGMQVRTVKYAARLDIASSGTSGVVPALSLDSDISIVQGDGSPAKPYIIKKSLESDIPVTSIRLNQSVVTLAAGQTEKLTVEIEPENASNPAVNWSVITQSSANVASVSEDGAVSALSPGTAVIRAAIAADPSQYADCTVTVAEAPLTGIQLSLNGYSFSRGESMQLNVAFTPSDFSQKTVLWEVKDQTREDVISVTDSGRVTAINPGSAVVRVTSTANSSIYAECTFYVIDDAVTGVAVNKPTVSLITGQTEQLEAAVTPPYALDPYVAWSISSQSPANTIQLSGNGLITALSRGTAVVRVTSVANAGIYSESRVTVNAPSELRFKSIAAGSGRTAGVKEDGTVMIWGGSNTFGENDVPAGLDHVKQVAITGRNTVVLREDGTVFAWGTNGSRVPAGLSNVKWVGAGSAFAVALKENGSGILWGEGMGEAGFVAPAISSDVKAISAATSYILALKEDGTVESWGSTNAVPEELTAGYKYRMGDAYVKVISVAAADAFSVALREDGTWVFWGWRDIINKLSGLNNLQLADISSFSAASSGVNGYVLVRKTNGELLAFGSNEDGLLNLPQGLSRVTSYAAGPNHAIALQEDQTAAVWGSNQAGQILMPLPGNPPAEVPVEGRTLYMNDIVYGNGKYVAVGDDGIIHTSVDGTSWNPVYLNTLDDLMSVVWNGTCFVAVGENADIFYSTDGEHWTDVSYWNYGNTIYDVLWDGSKFIASGEHLTLISFDGKLWSADYTTHSGSGEQTGRIKYAISQCGSQYIEAGGSGYVSTSNDGYRWSSKIIDGSTEFKAVVCNGETAVIGGYDYETSAPPYPVIYWSADGASWTEGIVDTQELQYMTYTKDIVWTGKKFVALTGSRFGNNGGTILVSVDGKKWDKVAEGNFDKLVWRNDTLKVWNRSNNLIEDLSLQPGGSGSGAPSQETIDAIDEVRISPVPNQVSGKSFIVEVEVLDAEGERLTGYNDVLRLSADGSGHILPESFSIRNGYAAVEVNILDSRPTTLMITAPRVNDKFKGGIYGLSNKFNVIAHGAILDLYMIEPERGDPLPGVQVTWNGHSYTSDEDGLVRFLSVPDDQRNMAVVLSKPGKHTSVRLLQLTDAYQKTYMSMLDKVSFHQYVKGMIMEPFEEDINVSLYAYKIQAGDTKENTLSVYIDWGAGNPSGTIQLKQGIRTLNPGRSRTLTEDGSSHIVEYLFQAPFGQVFQAGAAIDLIVKNADGSKQLNAVTTKILIQEEPVLALKSIKIDMGEFAQIKLPEDTPFIEGEEFSLNFLEAVQCKSTVDGDTIKIVIGNPVEGLKKLKKIYTQETPIEDVANLKKYLQKALELDDLNLGEDTSTSTTTLYNPFKSLKKEPLTVSGYMEGIRKSDGKIEVSGAMLISINIKSEVKRQLLIGYVPVFYKATIKADLSDTFAITAKMVNDKLYAELSNNIKLIISASGEVGAGLVDIVGLSVEGKLQGEVEIKVQGDQDPEVRAKVNSELNLIARIGTLEHKQTYPSTLWKYPNEATSKVTLNQFAEIYEVERYVLANRNYAEVPTVWESNQKKYHILTDSTNPRSASVLQTNVYPQAAPLLLDIPDDRMLVWLGDNTDRSLANRTEIQYSRYNPDTDSWSAPAAIHDDGTADFYVEAGQDNGDAFVIWQNIGQPIADEEAELTRYSSLSEILVSRYDRTNGAFEEPVRLTANDTLDFMPHISVNNGKALAVWLNNADNDLFGMNTGHRIMYAWYEEGAWSEQQVLEENAGTITTLSSAYDGVNGYVAYTRDTDQDLTTVEDRELFYLALDGQAIQASVRITDNEIMDSKPQAVIQDGRPALYWYSQNNISFIPDMTAVTQPVTEPEDTIFTSPKSGLKDDFQLVQKDGRRAVIWTEAANEGSIDIYSALYDSDTGEWSEDVKLSGSDRRIHSPDGMFQSDGSLVLAFNAAHMEEKTTAGGVNYYGDGQSDLSVLKIVPSYNLSVESRFEWDDARFYPETPLTLKLHVHNKGELTVNRMRAEVYEGNPAEAGAVLNQTVDIGKILKPGESGTVETAFLVPAEARIYDLYVILTPSDGLDMDMADNTAHGKVGYADLAIDELSVIQVQDTVLMHMELRNNSPVPVPDVTVAWYEQSLQGKRLGQKAIGTLRMNELVVLEEQLDLEQITFGQAGQSVYVQISSAAEEDNFGNNEDFVVISQQQGNPAGIDSAVATHYTDLKVFMGNVPSSNPTALSLSLSRTINGVEDTQFVWDGGVSQWDASARVLTIARIPYTPGAEYLVADRTDDALLLDIESWTQRDYANMAVILSEAPLGTPTSQSFTIQRIVNNEVEVSWDDGGYSTWYPTENKIELLYLLLNDHYPENSLIQYRLSYLDNQALETEAVAFAQGVQLSPLEVNHIGQTEYANASVRISGLPDGYRPNAGSVHVERYLDGVRDESFVWSGGLSSWNEADSQLKLANLPYSSGTTYIVTDKPGDGIDLIIDSVSVAPVASIRLRFNRSLVDPDNLNLQIWRELDDATDPSFSQTWSSYDPDTGYLQFYDISPVQTAGRSQQMVYYARIGSGEAVRSETYIIPAAPIRTITLGAVPQGGGQVFGGGAYREGASVTVTAEVYEGYTFAGWKESGITVSEAAAYTFLIGSVDRTLTAHFAGDPVANYAVVFRDWDGQILSSQTVREGEAAVAPAAPSRAGYVFTGWDRPFAHVTGDLTVTAVYLTIKPPVNNGAAVAADKEALEILFAPGDGENAVTQNLILSVTGAVYGSTISWTSGNTAVIGHDGAVVRPVYQLGDADVTVTAAIRMGEVSDEKVFRLKVLKRAPSGNALLSQLTAGGISLTPAFSSQAVDYSANVGYAASFVNIGTVPADSNARVVINGIPGADRRVELAVGENRIAVVVTAQDGVTKQVYTLRIIRAADAPVNQPDDNLPSPPSGEVKTPGTPTEEPATVIDQDDNTITIVTRVEAVSDPSGKASASVTQAQMDKAIQQAVSESSKRGKEAKAVIEIKVDAPADAQTIELTIPGGARGLTAGEHAQALTVTTPFARLTFDQQTLSGIAAGAEGPVKIVASIVKAESLSRQAREIVGDRPVYDFSVQTGEDTVSRFDGTVEVSVPYAAASGEDPQAIIIYYINADNEPEIIPNAVYNAATGRVTFRTGHFSQYAIGYRKVTFADVANTAWYRDAVSFLAARDVTQGTAAHIFSPEANITRGQFIVMLMRAYGLEPLAGSGDNFADAGLAYYTDYLAAAKEAGIARGIGDNLFAPEKEITRGEMFVFVYQTLKSIGKLPQATTGLPLSAFEDADQIASWAKEAIGLLVRTGTVSGDGAKLLPNELATRAQASQLLYNILSVK